MKVAGNTYKCGHLPWDYSGEAVKPANPEEQAEIDICLNCTKEKCVGNCGRVKKIGNGNKSTSPVLQAKQKDSVQQVRAIIAATGWSHRQVADKLGVSHNAIDLWLLGYYFPRKAMREKINELYKQTRSKGLWK
jgi:ribosome-binding protein aMBF1 (putative translation factor)